MFNKKIVDYLKFAREFNAQCPGFETDIHGLVEEDGPDGKLRYYADCVRAGATAARLDGPGTTSRGSLIQGSTTATAVWLKPPST